MSRKRLNVLVVMAVMLAMMLTSAGTASAAPCDGSCAASQPPGNPYAAALEHADARALEELAYVIERRGLR